MAERMTLARPYAKAIFEISDRDKSFDTWSEQLALLALIAKDPNVVGLLRDRNIAASDLVALILEVGGQRLEPLAQNLVRLLAKNHRLSVLPEVAILYEQQRSEAENSVVVELYTAMPITDAQTEKFKILLEKYLSKSVKLFCKIDKGLLGGFLARAGNYVIDGSLRSRLINLKDTMGG